MRSITIVMAVGLIASTVATAKSKRDRDRDRKDDEGWEDVEESAPAPEGPVQLKVPQSWAGKGYNVRVGSDLVALDKDAVSITRSDRRERVDIVDDTGRIVRSDRVYVDENMFDHFEEPREYHIGLFVGGANSNGKAFRKLLQDSHFQETSGEFRWQPTSIGLMLTFATQTNNLDHDFGVESTFRSSQTRLAVTYEFAPFRGGGNAPRIHFLSYAGALSASNKIKLEDDEVALEDSGASTGAIVGIDTMYPLNDFWISIRTYLSYQKIKFDDFDFETQSVQRGLLFGGFYAF